MVLKIKKSGAGGMGGWMGDKAGLRIAYSNQTQQAAFETTQKLEFSISYFAKEAFKLITSNL